MKVITLNGKVINIGEWDLCVTPVQNTEPRTRKEINEMKAKGLDPFLVYDGIREIHSQSDEHIYSEGKYDEQIKILIEEITLQ